MTITSASGDDAGCLPHFTLDRRNERTVLVCAGELDLSSVQAFDRTLRDLENEETLWIDLSGVKFADSYGLSPIFESARRRSEEQLPSLRVERTSQCVDRVLTLLHVPLSDRIEVSAWDAAEGPCCPSGG